MKGKVNDYIVLEGSRNIFNNYTTIIKFYSFNKNNSFYKYLNLNLPQ